MTLSTRKRCTDLPPFQEAETARVPGTVDRGPGYAPGSSFAPTSLVGLPVVVIPGVVIVFSAFLAWIIDFGASTVAAARDPERAFEIPAVRPYRWDQVDEPDPPH